jgi:hypothetical protein
MGSLLAWDVGREPTTPHRKQNNILSNDIHTRRWEDNIKIDVWRFGRRVLIGLIWLRIGSGGGLL